MIPQMGRSFIILTMDSIGECFFQSIELVPGLPVIDKTRWHLPAMGGSLLRFLDRLHDDLPEGLVAHAAAEASRSAQFRLGVTAVWAGCFQLGVAGTIIFLIQTQEDIREGKASGISHPHRFSAFWAQIDFLHLSANDVRQEDRCLVLLTLLADHKCRLRQRSGFLWHGLVRGRLR